jgi:hypothetical protein
MDKNFLQTGLWKILYNSHIRLKCVILYVRNTYYFNSMYFSHAFFNSINKKKIISHMSKWHMSLLHVSCMKFPTNQFIRKFCSNYVHIRSGSLKNICVCFFCYLKDHIKLLNDRTQSSFIIIFNYKNIWRKILKHISSTFQEDTLKWWGALEI